MLGPTLFEEICRGSYMGDVINLNELRRTHGDLQSTYRVSAEISAIGDAPSRRSAEIEDLYSPEFPANDILNRARQLLKEHDRRLNEAKDMLAEGDTIGADNEISLFQADLPELFCCRALSEGFAAIIVALHHAMQNRGGVPMTNEQMLAVLGCVQTLHANIFLSFTAALDLIDHLADAGLKSLPRLNI
jgi:hypothetical protein